MASQIRSTILTSSGKKLVSDLEAQLEIAKNEISALQSEKAQLATTNNFALANETPITVLASGATLTPDASKAYQTFTTSTNFTIAAPINRPSGRLRVYVVRIIYAGAHSATSIDAAYKYNGTAPAFSNANGKFDDLIISDDGTRITYELKAGYTS